MVDLNNLSEEEIKFLLEQNERRKKSSLKSTKRYFEKNKSINFDISEELYEGWNKVAEKKGVTYSTFIKKCVIYCVNNRKLLVKSKKINEKKKRAVITFPKDEYENNILPCIKASGMTFMAYARAAVNYVVENNIEI